MPADLVALALQRKIDTPGADPERVKVWKKALKARPAPVPLVDDLAKLNKDDLLDLAAEHGIDLPKSTKKDDIIEAVKES
jgi:hypothetical protein